MISIREANSDDYDAIAEVCLACGPEIATSSEHLREGDAGNPPGVVRQRWVAEENGQVLGHALLQHDRYFFDPKVLIFGIWILPDRRRQGLGSALLDRVQEACRRFGAEVIRSGFWETQLQANPFLEKRGFRETRRSLKSELEISAFDARPLLSLLARSESAGIVIRSLPEIAHDDTHRRRVYELNQKIEMDIPTGPNHRPMSFDWFWQCAERDCPTGEPFYVACKGDEFVGLHFAAASADGSIFTILNTGVSREYRGLGVATALKVRALDFAKKRGYGRASTWNHSENIAVLALNRKFGFKPLPAFVTVQRSS